jgi:oligoribonuclease NrnB/cAMP/cGMP phosphodiesterase (DHH superfamily)
MKIFYHNDADGKCAAHVIAYIFHHTLENNIEDYIEINYGMDFPLKLIEEDEDVFIVDYSIELEVMDKLLDITSNIFWIDHHITAIEKYINYPHNLQGLRNVEYSGCVLTYIYLYNVSFEQVPMPIRYIGDRDTWQWRYGQETKLFCSGAELYDLHPLSLDWEILFNNPLSVKKEGMIVEKYKTERNKDYVKSFAYYNFFEGYEAVVVNIGHVGSEIFDSIKKKPLLIMYVYDGKDYKVSLRSEEVDVSKIALKYGGGGHPGASGFECKEIPWNYVID